MTTADLVSLAEDEHAAPDVVRQVLAQLLRADLALGAATALGILAREPRVKPSRRLVIDPADDVLRRWRQRVEAAAALLEAPDHGGVDAELLAEFDDDWALAADARAAVQT